MNAPVTKATQAGTPNIVQLLAHAEAIVPRLRACANSTAENRRVGAEIVDDLKESGLLRLLQPRRFGGQSGDYLSFTRTIRTLAKGCGSTAWVYGVLGEHNRSALRAIATSADRLDRKFPIVRISPASLAEIRSSLAVS